MEEPTRRGARMLHDRRVGLLHLGVHEVARGIVL